MNKGVVIDASVVVKLFRSEEHTDKAKALIKYITKNDIAVIAPQLLITETINVSVTKGVAITLLLKFFEDWREKGGLIVTDLSHQILEKAGEIVEIGNSKSGYPHFPDSVYHAIAIENNDILVTSDHRHYAKTHKDFSHIVMLENWKGVFDV